MKNNITAEEVLEMVLYDEKSLPGTWTGNGVKGRGEVEIMRDIDPKKLSQLLADILNKLDEKKD